MTVRLITPPAAEPVTLEMARLHTRAEAVEDDALLTVLITAARQQGEGVTRRVFGESVWEVETGPLTSPFRLPLVPCMAVASVTVGGEAVDAGLYGFTPSGLSPQESPLRAAFIPGTDPPVDAGADRDAVRAAGGFRRGFQLQRVRAVIRGLPA